MIFQIAIECSLWNVDNRSTIFFLDNYEFFAVILSDNSAATVSDITPND